jgi:hypothetical protein
MLNLNKYVNRNKTTKDIVHTSGYAQVATQGTFGASSAESFGARRQVDLNRTIVRGYKNSKILSDSMPARSAPVATPEATPAPTPPPPSKTKPINVPTTR